MERNCHCVLISAIRVIRGYGWLQLAALGSLRSFAAISLRFPGRFLFVKILTIVSKFIFPPCYLRRMKLV
jgi:hypothetical protein